MKVKTLFRKGALAIIMKLAEHEKLHIRELSRMTNIRAGTIVNRVKELQKMGIIKVEEEKRFPFRKWVSLTDLGYTIAKFIIFLEEELQ